MYVIFVYNKDKIINFVFVKVCQIASSIGETVMKCT